MVTDCSNTTVISNIGGVYINYIIIIYNKM